MTADVALAEPQTGPQTFADVEEILAAVLPGYEGRPGQQKLAATIEKSIAVEVAAREQATREDGSLDDTYRPTHLLAHAPCGIGKSLAYLIPAILSGHRVLVSVTTKALQSQLASKDIPFLEQHLPHPFSWAELRGRSNYLCLARANSVEDPSTLTSLDRVTEYVRTHPEFDGLRESLPFEIPDNEWWDMHADTDDCKAAGCSDEQPEQVEVGGELVDIYSCYAVKARRKAASADLVIANHALLCVDLAIGNAILGDLDVIVLDEEHDLESVAAESLGFRLAVRSFTKLAADVHNFAHAHAIGDDADLLDPSVEDLNIRATELFEAIDAIRFPPNESTRRLKAETFDEISFGLTALRSAIIEVRRVWRSTSFDLQGSKRLADRRNRISSTLRNAADNLTIVLDAEQTEWVRWIEIEKVKGSRRGGPPTRRVLKAAPVSIAQYLDAKLWSQVPTIGVSATLKVKGSFRFLAGRLGISQAITLTVDSPFDFRRQGTLYVPTHLPVPKGAGLPAFKAGAIEEIIELIKASRGRTMVLFTAAQDMKDAAAAIRHRDRIPYELLMQYEATNKVLSERFKAQTDSVLFGTRSFFTGVDFAGETLSSLIIVKLPFAVPTEPITEARSERLEAEGKSSFGDYSLPTMSLLIQQATGRLIRHTTDIGVVTCLDQRLADTGYGQQILKDLPPFPVTRSFEDVQRFFATH